MKAATIVLTVLTAAHCSLANAVEQEFQITPRIGFGEIRLDPGILSIDLPRENDTTDVGVGFGFVTPIGVMLEVGLQLQTNLLDRSEDPDELTLTEQYIAAGLQLELGNGFRLTPKIGRTRWRLRSEDSPLFDLGSGSKEAIEGYEDFWEVSFTKTLVGWLSMGLRYRSTEYEFGRVESTMFVTTFGFR
jgi:hypothetical protein